MKLLVLSSLLLSIFTINAGVPPPLPPHIKIPRHTNSPPETPVISPIPTTTTKTVNELKQTKFRVLCTECQTCFTNKPDSVYVCGASTSAHGMTQFISLNFTCKNKKCREHLMTQLTKNKNNPIVMEIKPK